MGIAEWVEGCGGAPDVATVGGRIPCCLTTAPRSEAASWKEREKGFGQNDELRIQSCDASVSVTDLMLKPR